MKTNKIPSNLLQHNCYLRDVVPVFDKKTEYGDQIYLNVEEVTSIDSLSLKHDVTVQPYEITPQYVNSFVESADYRRDPFQAVLSAPKRKGLGDIRDLQKVNAMDDTQASTLFNQVKSRLSQVHQEQSGQQSSEPTEVK